MLGASTSSKRIGGAWLLERKLLRVIVCGEALTGADECKKRPARMIDAELPARREGNLLQVQSGQRVMQIAA
jgi:hypothetical protein